MFDPTHPRLFGLTPPRGAAVLLAFVVLLAATALVDARLSAFGQGLPEPLRLVFEWITVLGVWGLYGWPALALFALCAALARVSPKLLPRLALQQMACIYAFVFLAVSIPNLAASIAKRLLGRARPELYETVGSWDFTGLTSDWLYESFPSGHTTTAFAMAMVVGYLWPRWFVSGLLVALLVGLSRVVLGQHYATDVLGGFAFGAVGAALVRTLFLARGWVFVTSAGRVTMRPLSAVQRLVRRRRYLLKN